MRNLSKGRIEETHKQEVSADVKKAIDMINKGFYLVENNTALEHENGGYIKISKRVTNYLSSKITK